MFTNTPNTPNTPNTNNIKRAEIYYIDLSGSQSAEISKTRPCVIIQNDIGNKHSPNTIVAPITSKRFYNHIPTHVNINPVTPNTQATQSTVLCEQIRTVSKDRIKGYCGKLNEEDMKKVNKAIAISLGM